MRENLVPEVAPVSSICSKIWCYHITPMYPSKQYGIVSYGQALHTILFEFRDHRRLIGSNNAARCASRRHARTDRDATKAATNNTLMADIKCPCHWITSYVQVGEANNSSIDESSMSVACFWASLPCHWLFQRWNRNLIVESFWSCDNVYF